MTRQAVSSERAPAALGPYSQAIIAGGFYSAPGPHESTRPPAPHPTGSGPRPNQALRNLVAISDTAGVDGRHRQDNYLLCQNNARPLITSVRRSFAPDRRSGSRVRPNPAAKWPSRSVGEPSWEVSCLPRSTPGRVTSPARVPGPERHSGCGEKPFVELASRGAR